MGALNSSSWIDVGEGTTLATSDSYIYAVTYEDTLIGDYYLTQISRSTDGVDWLLDPAGFAPAVLINGASQIVATGATTYYLTKTGETWVAVDAGQIGETTNNGRFVNGLFFAFSATGVYRSSDGVTWTKSTLVQPPIDVAYWNSQYVFIADPGRAYATTDFASFTAYPLPTPLPFSVAASGTDFYYSEARAVYHSTDLYEFTEIVRFDENHPFDRSAYFVNLSIFDGVLFAGGGWSGPYPYLPDGQAGGFVTYFNEETASVVLVSGAVNLTYTTDIPSYFQPVVWGGSIYIPSGRNHLYRALYNAGWTAPTATAIIQGTLRLDTSDGSFAARDVYLYNYVDGAKVAETVSDGTTGEWQFTQVAPGEYFVVGVAHGDDLNIPRDFDALGVITVI